MGAVDETVGQKHGGPNAGTTLLWRVHTADADETRQFCLVRVGGVNKLLDSMWSGDTEICRSGALAAHDALFSVGELHAQSNVVVGVVDVGVGRLVQLLPLVEARSSARSLTGRIHCPSRTPLRPRPGDDNKLVLQGTS